MPEAKPDTSLVVDGVATRPRVPAVPGVVPGSALVSTRRGFSEGQLRTIRETVAKGTTDAEFNLFMDVCASQDLNPLMRDIYVFIQNPDDEKLRKLNVIVGIDGRRKIASRCGDYRPDNRPPRFTYDPDLKGPTNPAGIVCVEVSAWKFAHGEWHEVSDCVYWEEYVPLKEICEAGYDYVETGEVWEDSKRPKKKRVAKGPLTFIIAKPDTWGRMCRSQLAKCGETVVLRKGWPERFGGLYGEEEMDRAMTIEGTATEILHEAKKRDRERILDGSTAISFLMDRAQGVPMERIALGRIADRLMAFIESASLDDLQWFEAVNKLSLREFWTQEPGDCHEIKTAMTRRAASLSRDSADKPPNEPAGDPRDEEHRG